MKKKIENLSWFAIIFDFNEQKTKKINIFEHILIQKCVERIIDNKESIEEFIHEFDSTLRYCFWSKSEYELLVGKYNSYEKIDVYEQLKPNIETIAKYVYSTLGLSYE